MAIRPIVRYGDPVLHAPSSPVESIDEQIQSLLSDMVETMYAAPGIGLAAPQVGVPLRVIVIDLSVGEDKSQSVAELPLACSDEAAAVEFIERQRWGENPCCPHCGCLGVYQMRDRATGRGRDRSHRPHRSTVSFPPSGAACDP